MSSFTKIVKVHWLKNYFPFMILVTGRLYHIFIPPECYTIQYDNQNVNRKANARFLSEGGGGGGEKLPGTG